MKLVALELPDAYIVELEPHVDDRGFFARTWCSREFAEAGQHENTVFIGSAKLGFPEAARDKEGLSFFLHSLNVIDRLVGDLSVRIGIIGYVRCFKDRAALLLAVAWVDKL